MKIKRVKSKDSKVLFVLSFEDKEEFDDTLNAFRFMAEQAINEENLGQYTDLIDLWKERGYKTDAGYLSFLFEEEVPETISLIIILVGAGGLCIQDIREYAEEIQKTFSLQEEILDKQEKYIKRLNKEIAALKEDRERLINSLNILELGLAPDDEMKH